MQTGDGLLARINLKEGQLSPQQLEALANAALKYGNGLVEISTRGNVQVRGLRPDSFEPFAKAIEQAGIAINDNVPLLVPLLFAHTTERQEQGERLKQALQERLEQTDLFERLAAKTSLIIDAGGMVDLSGQLADVRAVLQEGEEWSLWIGGTQETARFAGQVQGAEAAAKAIMTALELMAARGNMVRGSDLDEEELARIVEHTDRKDAPRLASSASALIGVQALAGEKWMLGLGLPFGTINAVPLSTLAQILREAGVEKLMPLPGKILAIVGVSEQLADRLLGRAVELGFICEEADPRLKLITCSGAPACQAALLNTHQAASDLVEMFARQFQGDVRVHVSGCEKRCAAHGQIDLEIVGTPEGIEVANLAAKGPRSTRAEQILYGIAEKLQEQGE